MTDYGHDLVFGTFVTPTAARAEEVLELARLTEALGLDVFSVQDHPYLPKFLDAWTLLSVVAGQTSSLRVMPNVINLPLRPPAVLARSVASLDILSRGRVELGLGTGRSWDAIAAMGGPRRSPAESVVALEEAIAVIRGVWSTASSSLRTDGEHYSVNGVSRGPAPAHDIGIMLGAIKDRMLRLTGRLADGWLPSSPYVGPDALARSNAIIDDAARAAGRAPGDIRRLYNIAGTFARQGSGFLAGPPSLWAEQLTELSLTHGISEYLVVSDDPDVIRQFAQEVVPAVRDSVDSARRGSGALDDRLPFTAGPADPAGPRP